MMKFLLNSNSLIMQKAKLSNSFKFLKATKTSVNDLKILIDDLVRPVNAKFKI